jgi:hypothetical protein
MLATIYNFTLIIKKYNFLSDSADQNDIFLSCLYHKIIYNERGFTGSTTTFPLHQLRGRAKLTRSTYIEIVRISHFSEP